MSGGDEAQRESSSIGPVLLSVALPGVTTLDRRRWLGLLLLGVGVVLPVAWLFYWVLRDRTWVALGLDRRFLGQSVVVLAVALLARVVAVVEQVHATRGQPRHHVRTGVAVAVLVAIAVPTIVGANTAVEARSDIDRAFESSPNAPIYDASALTTTTTTTPPTTSVDAPTTVAVPTTEPASSTPTTTGVVPPASPLEWPEPPPVMPTPPDSGVDPEMLRDVSTILLLGGDAGPGRSGLRTDSMILVSIHRPSGRAALISVPRNLENLLFPPGTVMEQRYPYGFGDIANAVYPRVSSNQELRDAYTVGELRPGAVAIAQGIGYSLDVTIDDYVLIDMQGFLELIDALGGVTVDVGKAVPAPGNPPGALHTVPPVIPAGVQHMDGTTALSYVRSRKADTDYQRARRQRQVLASLASQIGVANAIAGYSAVTSILGERLRTSLTTEEFTNLLALLGGETAIVESMGLVPPLVVPNHPNYDAMAKMVGEVQMALVTGTPSGY